MSDRTGEPEVKLQNPSEPTNTYPREVVKEYVLQRLRLTPSTWGRTMDDVPNVVRDIGGLQYGGHGIELFNRFEGYRSEWFDHWYENYTLIEGHVLRGALRIVTPDEYPYYFKATRSVARKRRYQNCPSTLNRDHDLACELLDRNGPLTSPEFKELFRETYPRLESRPGKLLQDLYNYGRVARMGRKKQKPIFHTIERLPYSLDMLGVSEEEARGWLTLKSLSIYGPSNPRDIAHWVGWNLNETREIIKSLLSRGEIVKVRIEGDQDTFYLRAEDIPLLDSLSKDLPEYSFVRILFNDDALLLGYLPRLKSIFGYDWRYPQFSEGVVWRAGVLCGRELIGGAVVEMYASSDSLKVKELTLRKEFADPETLSMVEEEFRRHADFQNKALEINEARLI